MRISQGSITELRGGRGGRELLGKGVLTEDLNLNLKSEFKSFSALSGNDWQEVISNIGMVMRDLSGGAISFGGEFKQATLQVWNNTSPLSLQITVEFHRLSIPGEGDVDEVSGRNVVEAVKKICRIPLPEEGFGGNLKPPGPSIIEGITGLQNNSEEGSVTLRIGSFVFPLLLLVSAVPQFSMYADSSGYPISCKVAMNFESLWAATKNLVDAW